MSVRVFADTRSACIKHDVFKKLTLDSVKKIEIAAVIMVAVSLFHCRLCTALPEQVKHYPDEIYLSAVSGFYANIKK